MSGVDQGALLDAVFAAIDEVNESLPQEKQFSKSMDTVLFDPSGRIDSLGVTVFIVAVEQKVEQQFNCAVALTGEYKLTDAKSPLRTVGSLVSHIRGQLEKSTP